MCIILSNLLILYVVKRGIPFFNSSCRKMHTLEQKSSSRRNVFHVTDVKNWVNWLPLHHILKLKDKKMIIHRRCSHSMIYIQLWIVKNLWLMIYILGLVASKSYIYLIVINICFSSLYEGKRLCCHQLNCF